MNRNDTRLFNILSYFGPLFVAGLIVKPQDADVRFHANQGLILFLAEIVLSLILTVLKKVLGLIPILGVILNVILAIAFWALVVLYVLYGVRSALQNKEKELPYIGHLQLIR